MKLKMHIYTVYIYSILYTASNIQHCSSVFGTDVVCALSSFSCRSAIRPSASDHPARASQSDARTWSHGPTAVSRDGEPSSQHSVGEGQPTDPGQRRAHQPHGERHLTDHQPAGRRPRGGK